MCSEPVTYERGGARLSAHVKAYGPDQYVLPTLAVGVTAHHLASALDPVAGIVSTIVSGQSPSGIPMEGHT